VSSERRAHLDRVDCAVLVVTYNSVADVGGLLDSLPAAAAGLTLRTVVVDNGSTDGTVELLRGRPDVRLVVAGANLGYAGGINLARGHAGPCDSVLVVNPDLTLAPGTIAELAEVLRDPAVGVAVPMILNPDGGLEQSLRREPSLSRAIGDALLGRRLAWRPHWLSEMVRCERAYASQRSVDWATGAAALISAACDAAVGPWDERFFLYSEEVDHAARVRAAGFRIEYVPTARARHRAGGSGSSDALVALMAVNRVRYVAKRGRGAGIFRAVVALHELLRARDPSHRLALRTVLNRSRWEALPGGPAATTPAARNGPR
jgi:GT2 family glycosyltransferase